MSFLIFLMGEICFFLLPSHQNKLMRRDAKSVKASIQTCGLTLEQNEEDFKARTCVLVPGWRVKQVTHVTAAANLPFPLGCGETSTQSPFAVLTGFWGPTLGLKPDQTGTRRPRSLHVPLSKTLKPQLA